MAAVLLLIKLFRDWQFPMMKKKLSDRKQVDSMLPCMCSVTDYRWCQNVVRKKKKAHKAQLSVSQMFLHILMSSVIFHYWTDPWQHGTSLFYKIKEQNIVNGDTIYASFLQKIISKNKWKCKNNSAYHIMSFWGQITSFVRQKNPITVTGNFGKDCNTTLQKLP